MAQITINYGALPTSEPELEVLINTTVASTTAQTLEISNMSEYKYLLFMVESGTRLNTALTESPIFGDTIYGGCTICTPEYFKTKALTLYWVKGNSSSEAYYSGTVTYATDTSLTFNASKTATCTFVVVGVK